MNSKNIYIIAGPNGSGKTTFAREFLPTYVKCTNFVNADLIAQGLSPFSPRIAAMKAGRLVIEQLADMTRRNMSFAFETTLSGRTYIRFLTEAKRNGYRLHLFFLWIPSVRLALQRIKGRVAEGGHDVPSVDVRRRFDRSTRNFMAHYKPLMDLWMLFDNSGATPRLIAEEKAHAIHIFDKEFFDGVFVTRNRK